MSLARRTRPLLLFFFIVSIGFANQVVRTLKFGKRMKGHDFRTLPGISLTDCYKECRSRRKCVSFNYFFLGKWCILTKASRKQFPNDLDQKLGFAFSDRSKWEKDEKTERCEICRENEKCRNNAVKPCFIEECDPPGSIGDGRVLGNNNAVGTVLKHVCYNMARKMASSSAATCLTNGSWSKAENFSCVAKTICPSNYGWYEQGSFCYMIDGVSCETWASARAICQRNGGDLLTLADDETATFFKALLEMTALDPCSNAHNDVWLGASDEAHEGQWEWVTGEFLSNNSKLWWKNQPNNLNGRQYCLETLEVFFLNDDFCGKKTTFCMHDSQTLD